MVNLTPAQKHNGRYKKEKSDFMTPEERLNNILKYKGSSNDLTYAIETYKILSSENEQGSKELPLGYPVQLSKIRIDDTQNRPVNWQHLLSIISSFDPTIVQGVSCYEDPDAPGCYIAYDGQHTCLSIYAIYCKHLGIDPEQVIIPAVVTRTNKKSEIRNVFIKIASPKLKKEDQGVKLSLSPYNLFQQMIFGVRIDRSENPIWKAAEMKQRLLEDAHLYMKDENEFHVPIENGCITSPNDIINASLHSVQKFCEYWKERRKIKDEIVHIKELTIVLALMDRFKDIKLSQEDYELMVDVFYNSFAFNYRPQSKLYANVDNAFNDWFKMKYHPNCDWEDLDDEDMYDLRQKGAPIYPKPLTHNSIHQTKHTVTYLCALLTKKGFTKVPRSDDIFVPDMEYVS